MGKSAEAWVVHVETQRYGSATRWLSRDASYVIRAELVLAEKDGGTRVTSMMT